MPNLTSAEIISIVKACREHGVTRFTLEKLDVTFDGYRPPAPVATELARAFQEADEWSSYTPPAPVLPTEVDE